MEVQKPIEGKTSQGVLLQTETMGHGLLCIEGEQQLEQAWTWDACQAHASTSTDSMLLNDTAQHIELNWCD